MRGVRLLSGRCVTFTEEKGWGSRACHRGLENILREFGPLGFGSIFLRTFLVSVPLRGLPRHPTRKPWDSGWWSRL